jgi:hypothetical protein
MSIFTIQYTASMDYTDNIQVRVIRLTVSKLSIINEEFRKDYYENRIKARKTEMEFNVRSKQHLAQERILE